MTMLGLYKSFEGRDYTRELVRMRDKHTCQKCKKEWDGNGRRFHVHHLNGLCGKNSTGYDRVSEMRGLITLCGQCHSKTHGRSGTNIGRLKDKTKQILKLRRSGLTYKRIGETLGVSGCAVIKHLQNNTRH